MNVRIKFRTWHGDAPASRSITLDLPEQLAAQVLEAAACEHPAGLPEVICNALNACAAIHGERLDYMESAAPEQDMVRKLILGLRGGGSSCDVCRNQDASKAACKTIAESGECPYECRRCPAISSQACGKCHTGNWMDGFEWTGEIPEGWGE